MCARFVALALLLSLCSAPATLRAGWPANGAAVGSGPGDHSPANAGGTTVCTDTSGGAIVAYRMPSGDEIRINRVSGVDGLTVWNGADGVLVTDTAAGPPHVTSDGRGGAWVAWSDTRTTGSGSGLYVQHFDADGNGLLFGNGTRLSGGAAVDVFGHLISIATASTGDLLISWHGEGASEGVWIQRVLLSGSFGPFAKVSSDADVERIQLVADDLGAVTTWSGARAGDQGIWANRVTSDGTILWGASGRQVMDRGFGPSAKQHTAAWNGESLFVTWSHQRTSSSGVRDVHAQRLNAQGSQLWGSPSLGLLVLAAPMNPGITPTVQSDRQPRVVATADGGCLIVWRDDRRYFEAAGGGIRADDIYGQRLSVSGLALWTSNGEAIDASPGTQTDPWVVPYATGAGVVVYMTYENTSRDIKARALSVNGNASWTRTPAATGDEQDAPMVASNGAGGFVVAWEDDRLGDVDVFATHYDANGFAFDPVLAMSEPTGGATFFPGEDLPFAWTTNVTGPLTLRYERPGFAPVTIAEVAADVGSFSWTAPNFPSTPIELTIEDVTGSLVVEATVTICSPPFANFTPSTGFDGARDLVLEDFDGDGRVDAAVAAAAGVLLAPGLGNGAFAAPSTIRLRDPAIGIAATDLNRDGVLDLIVTHGDGFSVMKGFGTGFTPSDFTEPFFRATGKDAGDLAWADFDEDGFQDLVVANVDDDAVAILLGRGDGEFVLEAVHAVAAHPERLRVFDTDGDDVLDVVVTCRDANVVQRLLGIGAGSVGSGAFAPAATIVSTTSPRGLEAADIDGDGAMDLVIGNLAANISVAFATAGGSFEAPLAVAGEADNRDVVVGDFTGDGLVDVVAVATGFNQLSLYRNTGNGMSGVAGLEFFDTFGTGAVPEAVGASDLDGDGWADIVSANRITDNLTAWTAAPADCKTASIDVTVVSPNGGESFGLGGLRSIEWTAGSANTNVHVEVTHDGGATWTRIASHVNGTSFTWHVTGPLTASARIRVRDALVETRSDNSDAAFSIVTSTDAPSTPGHATVELLPPSPNPFNPRTRIDFTLSQESAVTLTVHDAGGRRVATLVDGRAYAVGRHDVVWTGVDDAGRSVASGVYFVRLTAPGIERNRSVVLVR